MLSRMSTQQAESSSAAALAHDRGAPSSARAVEAHPRLREQTAERQRGALLERAASWLSLACAVHCLVMPLALGALPLLGASAWQLDASIDHTLSVLVIVGAVAGSLWGYRRHHQLRLVLASALGLAVYLLGHALEPQWYGVFAVVLGALVLAVSAFFSARLGHAHVHPHHSDAPCAH